MDQKYKTVCIHENINPKGSGSEIIPSSKYHSYTQLKRGKEKEKSDLNRNEMKGSGKKLLDFIPYFNDNTNSVKDKKSPLSKPFFGDRTQPIPIKRNAFFLPEKETIKEQFGESSSNPEFHKQSSDFEAPSILSCAEYHSIYYKTSDEIMVAIDEFYSKQGQKPWDDIEKFKLSWMIFGQKVPPELYIFLLMILIGSPLSEPNLVKEFKFNKECEICKEFESQAKLFEPLSDFKPLVVGRTAYIAACTFTSIFAEKNSIKQQMPEKRDETVIILEARKLIHISLMISMMYYKSYECLYREHGENSRDKNTAEVSEELRKHLRVNFEKYYRITDKNGKNNNVRNVCILLRGFLMAGARDWFEGTDLLHQGIFKDLKNKLVSPKMDEERKSGLIKLFKTVSRSGLTPDAEQKRILF